MRLGRSVAVAVLVLTMFAVALVVVGCEDLGDETTTTPAAATTTTFAAGTKVIDEAADGTSVHLEVGDTLALRLRGNPTTGYTWRFGDAGDPILLRQGDWVYTPDSDAVGAGGVYQAVYLAVEAGITFIALDYVGPDGQVDHNYYVDVVVGDAGAADVTTETTAVAEATTTETAAEVPGDGGEDPGPVEEATTTTTSERVSELIRLDERDHGRTVGMRVGDRLEIVVPLHPVGGLTAKLKKPDTDIFDVVEIDDGGGALMIRLRAIRRGETKIVIEYQREDGTLDSRKWAVEIKVI